jgi:hypothetical protein
VAAPDAAHASVRKRYGAPPGKVSERQRNLAYKDAVAAYARALINLALKTAPELDRVVLTLVAPQLHRTLGHRFLGPLLSVPVDRATWDRIIHANVTDEAALQNFALHFDYSGSHCGLKIVAGYQMPGSTNGNADETPLGALEPAAFEARVRDLLAAMGFQATLTQASHDGGIDIEAFNPTPISGGKVIVQCKRYAGTVGAAAVRDLYGVVTDRRVTKGILITTGGFSADATRFADGKPLELIDGPALNELVRRWLA